LPLETPGPFVLSHSAMLRRALLKDEFAEIYSVQVPKLGQFRVKLYVP